MKRIDWEFVIVLGMILGTMVVPVVVGIIFMGGEC